MKKYIALGIAVIILAGGAFFTQQWYIESYSPTPTSQVNVPAPITFTAVADGTVLDVMRSLAAEGRLSFSGRDFPGLGFFVEEMGGKKSENGYYWILLINGKKSDLGASSARIEVGDVVEWRYEEGY